LAVDRGAVLGPAQIGVLASVGCAMVPVYRRPHVAVLASGDELVDIDQFELVRRGERIVSSNSYTIAAAARAAGAEVLELGIAPDDPDAYRERLAGARGCDLLVTSGGVSVGAFDFTRDVLRSLGAELQLWRVRMRPGAPLGFGMLDGMPWLGLPGNPVSAMVTFELFARPLLRKQLGAANIFRRTVDVRVLEDITLAAPLTHFMRGIVEWTAEGAVARLTGGPARMRCSSFHRSAKQCDAASHSRRSCSATRDSRLRRSPCERSRCGRHHRSVIASPLPRGGDHGGGRR
jgi:molybdopterin molybdotransferase